jgi:hypothetical protein
MNKLNYILKYAEYLIRKTRVFVTRISIFTQPRLIKFPEVRQT